MDWTRIRPTRTPRPIRLIQLHDMASTVTKKMDVRLTDVINAVRLTMDAPRCRICGAHWPSEPCQFVGRNAPKSGAERPAVDQVRPRVKRKAKRGTFNRTAYQKDYMRKWRGGTVGKKYRTTG